jgi:hypothetical protein
MLLRKLDNLMQKDKLDPFLSPCIIINSKCCKDPNTKPETLKLMQKRAGNTLELIDIGKGF